MQATYRSHAGHMRVTCRSHVLYITCMHTCKSHAQHIQVIQQRITAKKLYYVCVYICAVLKGSVIRGVLTFSPVNVIKVVEGVLHDAVAYLTEISGNSKKGWNSREGETVNKDYINPLNRMLAYIRTYVCTYIRILYLVTYIHRVVKNLCTDIQYIYNTNFSYK